jgi:hypothetical protein
MRTNGKLSRLERALAAGLSVVWLFFGCKALYLALSNSRWGMAVLASGAVVYGFAWIRVAILARLLSWREIVAPWRPIK